MSINLYLQRSERELPKGNFSIKIVFRLMYTLPLSAFFSLTHTASHTYVTFWHIIEAGSISTTCCWKCWRYWIIYSIFCTLQNRFRYFDTFWSLPYGYFMVAELPDAQVLWQSSCFKDCWNIFGRISPCYWFLWSGEILTFLWKCFSR